MKLAVQNEKKIDIRQNLRSMGIVLFGVIMVAFSISVILVPNKIVCGGVSGVSTILYYVFGFEPGVSYAVINGILLLCGIKLLGKEFIVKTLISAGLLSVFVWLFGFLPPIKLDLVLATVFGGALYGFGIGLTLICNASSGGTDILSRILQLLVPHIPIGKVLLVVDGLIVFSSLLIFKQIDLALYGVITLAIETVAIDWLIQKLNVSKFAFVITEKGEEIARKLVNSSPRGVTILPAIGAYTEEPRNVLLCAMKDNEMVAFKKKIEEWDENAFIVFSESEQIMGNGFYVYH